LAALHVRAVYLLARAESRFLYCARLYVLELSAHKSRAFAGFDVLKIDYLIDGAVSSMVSPVRKSLVEIMGGLLGTRFKKQEARK